ncbi:hypothetical protein CN645_03280 [Burkholderia sp. IDO3]|nr:hypothetical protein DCN14_08825 [Burkholderia sp. IDO3]PCD63417.1 hypothetical protein CN645_03280 [Burkholderia sp. IDO3]
MRAVLLAHRQKIVALTFCKSSARNAGKKGIKRVDASHDDPLPSPPSNYMECSVNTDASCSWSSTNLTAA